MYTSGVHSAQIRGARTLSSLASSGAQENGPCASLRVPPGRPYLLLTPILIVDLKLTWFAMLR